MHGEASVCDPFDIPDSDRHVPAKDSAGIGSSSPTPGLDVTGASISSATGEDGNRDRDAPSIVLPHQDASYISHIALDIGGSLIKLVYFSSDKPGSDEKPIRSSSSGSSSSHTGGNLHFVKFETSKIGQCLDFIKSKNLHHCPDNGQGKKPQMRVQATGGGAFKYADMFQEQLGLILEKEDEMECLVGGCNFLLKAIRHEAFTYENGALNFVTNTGKSDSDLYPYLLVNIGSGVSLLKVEGDGQYERVSGSSLGGGTFWGLCRLLTRCKSFDEMLELSMRGDNSKVDMLVGDIYGDRDYSNIGLSATTIASSFGKVVSEGKDLEDVDPADIALALCRMVSYNIGHLAYLNAKRYGLPRVLFGGFFIRGHPYTMETISFAIKFWSK
ncbi:MAG: pantothenate kinase 2, partial [Trebouxia sp. A1-2]